MYSFQLNNKYFIDKIENDLWVDYKQRYPKHPNVLRLQNILFRMLDNWGPRSQSHKQYKYNSWVKDPNGNSSKF